TQAVAERHAHQGRDLQYAFRRDRAWQPPAEIPVRILERDVFQLEADRLEQAGDIIAILVIFDVERPRWPEDRLHHGVRFLLDPEGAAHEPEIRAPWLHAQLDQPHRPTVRQPDLRRVA